MLEAELPLAELKSLPIFNMITEWAIVNDETSIVELIILWDGTSEYQLPSGTSAYKLLYSTQAQIGYTRNPDGSYSPPPQDA